MKTNKTKTTKNYTVPACNLCKGNCYGCYYSDLCTSWNGTGNGYVIVNRKTGEVVDY